MNFKEIVKKLMETPHSIIVTGDLKTGKTDFSLLFVEKAFDLQLIEIALTNIKIIDSRGYDVRTINNNLELEKYLRNLKRHNMRSIFILDEAGLILSSRRVLSKKNELFMKLSRLARKYFCTFIFVTQRLQDLDPALRSLCIGIFEKTSKKHAYLRSPLFPYEIELVNIPKTKIKFDTYDIAEFRYLTEEEAKKLVLKEVITEEEFRILKALKMFNFNFAKTARYLQVQGYKYRGSNDLRYDFIKIMKKIIDAIETQIES